MKQQSVSLLGDNFRLEFFFKKLNKTKAISDQFDFFATIKVQFLRFNVI